MKHAPLYYRYVYSPTTGDVDLSHNQESHPAEVATHGAMCAGRPEADLLCGYVYRLGGGWRVLDADHRPVNDPHIIASVIQNLASAEHFKTAAGDKQLSTGGPTIMPCPVCGEIGCNQCEIPMGYEPRVARLRYGKLVSAVEMVHRGFIGHDGSIVHWSSPAYTKDEVFHDDWLAKHNKQHSDFLSSWRQYPGRDLQIDNPRAWQYQSTLEAALPKFAF